MRTTNKTLSADIEELVTKDENIENNLEMNKEIDDVAAPPLQQPVMSIKESQDTNMLLNQLKLHNNDLTRNVPNPDSISMSQDKSRTTSDS